MGSEAECRQLKLVAEDKAGLLAPTLQPPFPRPTAAAPSSIQTRSGAVLASCGLLARASLQCHSCHDTSKGQECKPMGSNWVEKGIPEESERIKYLKYENCERE